MKIDQNYFFSVFINKDPSGSVTLKQFKMSPLPDLVAIEKSKVAKVVEGLFKCMKPEQQDELMTKLEEHIEKWRK